MTMTWCQMRKPRQPQCWRKYFVDVVCLCARGRKAGGRNGDNLGEPASDPGWRFTQQ